MHAKELIGKMAIRSVPTKRGDRSYTIGHGVKILNTTTTHVYIMEGGKPYALSRDYMDGWELFDPYPDDKPAPYDNSEMRGYLDNLSDDDFRKLITWRVFSASRSAGRLTLDSISDARIT